MQAVANGSEELPNVNALLVGAIDLHHHGYPEISFDVRTRTEDVEELRLSQQAGMAAVVLKSHMWPTVGRAYLLNKMDLGIQVIPSITLNTICGGFDPIAVESAALQGAKVVFMPTWSAANDIEQGGFSRLMKGYIKAVGGLSADRGLRVRGPGGHVLPEVKECLAVAAQYGMVVCTAHLSPDESIALATCAKDFGIQEVVFSHPDSRSVGASREQIRDMAQLDALCEFCVLGSLPGFQRISPQAIIEIVEEISPERAIITTDYFMDWNPPGAEMLRMMMGSLLEFGMPFGHITKMVRTNPERLLGWGR